MDYLKTVSPSQLLSERGSNLVIINPGSGSLRIGLATHDKPFNVPNCIARHNTRTGNLIVPDQILNNEVTTSQQVDRERAYNTAATLLKIPFLDEGSSSGSASRKMGKIDGFNKPSTTKKDSVFTWTNVYENKQNSPTSSGTSSGKSKAKATKAVSDVPDSKDTGESNRTYRKVIFGEEALKISSKEPYSIHHPIRRGHFNVSPQYSAQQVCEDLVAILDWILLEKLHIVHSERSKFSAVIIVPETFDSREIKEMLTIVLQDMQFNAAVFHQEQQKHDKIKEMLTIVLRDLQFNTAVVHQEGLATTFGNGLSTACVVNVGAQTSTVVCIEDGASLPNTEKILPFGGEDICRCLLWIQRHYQNWPQIATDVLAKPVDMLMLNQLKESHCEIKAGQLETVATVHSYEDGLPAVPHRTNLTSLNVPPMGLFYPNLLVPEVFPLPPREWFKDYENMLEETWNMEFALWESYGLPPMVAKKEEKISLAEAIISSILSAGRIDLKRKLFSSIQLVGGVGSTKGLVSAVEERVRHAIPPTEAIDNVAILPSRSDSAFVPWKGGTLLGVLDFAREAWVERKDWMQNGIHIGSGKKYKDSFYIQGQAMSFINS